MLKEKAKYLAPLLTFVLSMSLSAFAYTPLPAAAAAGLAEPLNYIPTSPQSVAVASAAMTGVTRNVPSEYPTIQAAINSAGNGDTIIVAPGTYSAGILWYDKYLTIKSANGADTTIIDGGGTQFGMSVQNMPYVYNSGLLSTLSGFTFRNGRGVGGIGGGVTLTNRADLILENNIIENNVAPDVVVATPCAGNTGGGLLINQGSHPLVRGNIIRNNRAAGLGGGIYIVNNSNPNIVGNTIVLNAADSGNPACNPYSSGGGLMVIGSVPRILNNVIMSNRATGQGGGISYGGSAAGIFEGNTVSGNSGGVGGGIEMETGGSGPFIYNNQIYSNTAINNSGYQEAGMGGGVAVFNKSKPLVKGNQIYNNTALRYGAGVVSSEDANWRLISNKIYGNRLTADEVQYCGGGLYAARSTMYIANNVFYKNEAFAGAGVCLQGLSATTVVNNTIVYNKNRQNQASFNQTLAWVGAGILSVDGITSGFIQNNIISDNTNTAGNNAVQVFEQGKKLRLVSNLITNTGLGLYFNYATREVTSAATLNSNDANIDADLNRDGNPSFVNAANDNYNINANSAAVDTGYDVGVPNDDIAYRVRINGLHADIGAYEYYATNTPKIPVFRFYSQPTGQHFFTTSVSERDYLVRNFLFYYFGYMGVAFDAYATQVTGTVPLYRFSNKVHGGRYYTINEAEKNNLIANSSNEYTYEGIGFYVMPVTNTCPVPVYHFYNAAQNLHFFTASVADRDKLQNTPNSGWAYGGIKFCAPPNSI